MHLHGVFYKDKVVNLISRQPARKFYSRMREKPSVPSLSSVESRVERWLECSV